MLETGLYAGILALIYVVLTARVVRIRLRTKTKLGDGGHMDLVNAIRAHGNFAEYVPFALLLIALLNFQGINPAVIHGLGCLLVAGRLVHAYSITKDILKLRPVGMGMTLGTIIIAASTLIIRFFT